MRIAIVAGETSGDSLGAGLMTALRAEHPECHFMGIGGPRMSAIGMEVLYPMERISIMGLDGLLEKFGDILTIRRHLTEYILQQKPDGFIGIDVPDFNLSLELKLKQNGIPTVHYVSPTVWAWRQYRLRKIRRAVDRMLTLFPFEADYYHAHHIPVNFVGHPIADAIDKLLEPSAARSRLNLPEQGQWLALLPGSRKSEVDRLGPLFIRAAEQLLSHNPKLRFMLPIAHEEIKNPIEQMVSASSARESIFMLDGQARLALRAADIALVASGTAALESALLETPMVVAYKVSPMSYFMIKLFSRVKHYSMPNHLLDKPIVPELIQQQATAENLVQALIKILNDKDYCANIRQDFAAIRTTLTRDASRQAADAVLQTFLTNSRPN